jgi:trans-aconitate methyltransferase
LDIIDKVPEKRSDINYIISDIKVFKPEGEFDIVIDDGSHQLVDVLFTVRNFKLKEGGVMVIEDCQHPKNWYRTIKANTRYHMEEISLQRFGNKRDNFLIALHNYGYFQ